MQSYSNTSIPLLIIVIKYIYWASVFNVKCEKIKNIATMYILLL